MALQCQLVSSTLAYQAGQSPPPSLALVVYNPNAGAVSVTGVELIYMTPQGVVQRPSMSEPLVPIGVGQTTSVPALSSITIGPFALAVGSVSSANSYQMVPPGTQPFNSQGAHAPQQDILIGANVYGSDGSVNVAGRARVLVSFSVAPPPGYQGGVAQFQAPNNACLITAGVA